MATRIDRQILNPQLVAATRAASSQQRMNARKKFGKGERLYQIVVSAELESFNAIGHAVAGGEKNNRCSETSVAELFNQRPSIFPGKHYINDQEIELAVAGHFKSSGAIS